MMEHNYRSLKQYKFYSIVLAFVLAILFSFPALSLSRSKRPNQDDRFKDTINFDQKMYLTNQSRLILKERYWNFNPLDRGRSSSFITKNYRKNYNRLTPEEKMMLEKRYHEWESLPEKEQKLLRRRMEKYKRLSPQDQKRFQQRHRQFQKLSPDERYIIRQKLQKWDSLSPDEKDQIRQRFREP